MLRQSLQSPLLVLEQRDERKKDKYIIFDLIAESEFSAVLYS